MKKLLLGLFFCFLSLNAMRKKRKVCEGSDLSEGLRIMEAQARSPYVWVEHQALDWLKNKRRENVDNLPTLLGEFSKRGSLGDKRHADGVLCAIKNAKFAMGCCDWSNASATLRPLCLKPLGSMSSFVLKLEYIKVSLKAGPKRSYLSDVIRIYGKIRNDVSIFPPEFLALEESVLAQLMEIQAWLLIDTQ